MNMCESTHPTTQYADGQRTIVHVACLAEVDEDGRHRSRHWGWEDMPGIPAGSQELLGRPLPEHDIPPWTRLWTWSDGGAAGNARHRHAPSYCTGCNVPFFPGHHVRGADGGDQCTCAEETAERCWTCGEWAKRVARYADGKILRPHPGGSMDDNSMYSFSPSNPGGFGGMKVTVVMDDGTVIANNQAGLWSGGTVPWWLRDQMPPNCRITTGGEHQLVPGYTDRAGRPLEFMGHPEVRPS